MTSTTEPDRTVDTAAPPRPWRPPSCSASGSCSRRAWEVTARFDRRVMARSAEAMRFTHGPADTSTPVLDFP